MMRKWTAALLCLTLTLGLALGGCAPAATKQSRSGFFFDTVISMTVYTNDETLLDDAQAECRRYDDLLSKTKEGSDVWRINHAGGEWVAVSEDTRDIIEKALEYARLSDGGFDITVEPCVALWDFTGDKMGVLPDEAALAAAADKVDWKQVEVGDEGVRLPAGMTIDLGAIAKGYITDRIAGFLKDRGVKSGLLNFGGNVLTIGAKPDGTPWSIGVQDPQGLRSYLGVVEVEGEAVVTSGIYERGFDLDGVRYHHILDPATGWPVQNELAGVSILAEDAFDADALSTTVFAMGLEGGTAFIEGLDGIEAVFVTRDGAVTWTSGLEGRFTLQEQ